MSAMYKTLLYFSGRQREDWVTDELLNVTKKRKDD